MNVMKNLILAIILAVITAGLAACEPTGGTDEGLISQIEARNQHRSELIAELKK
jgi:hypothetical protein